MKKRAVVLSTAVVVVIIAVLGVFLVPILFRGEKVDAADVSTAHSENGGLTLNLTGQVDSRTKAAVYPEVEAPVTRIMVVAGDRVQEGQVVAVLDTSKQELEAQSKAAEAQTRRVEGDVEQRRAQENLARITKEVQEGNHPDQVSAGRAVRDAEAAIAAANAEAKAAEVAGDPGAEAAAKQRAGQAQRALDDAQRNAQLVAERLRQEVANAQKNANDTAAVVAARQAQASTELQKTQITGDPSEVRAPFGGVVGEVLATAGQPASGALLTIIDDSAIVVHTSVRDVDVAAVRPGMKARFTTSATGNREFTGVVEQVSPVSGTVASRSEDATGRPYFPVQIRPDGDVEPLLVGAVATIELVVEEPTADADPDLVLVPAGAVADGSVLVLGPGQVVERRQVTPLTTQGARIEVRGDIRAGEQVLENPQRYAGLVGKPVTIHGN